MTEKIDLEFTLSELRQLRRQPAAGRSGLAFAGFFYITLCNIKVY